MPNKIIIGHSYFHTLPAGNANRIEFKGESLRKKKTEKNNKFTNQIHRQPGGSLC